MEVGATPPRAYEPRPRRTNMKQCHVSWMMCLAYHTSDSYCVLPYISACSNVRVAFASVSEWSHCEERTLYYPLEIRVEETDNEEKKPCECQTGPKTNADFVKFGGKDLAIRPAVTW